MLILTAPAKTLELDRPFDLSFIATKPDLLTDSEFIAQIIQKYDEKKLANILGISEKLAKQNFIRYQNWDIDKHNSKFARPALFMYAGDIYEKMSPYEYTPAMQKYAEASVRILSGLYGVLNGFNLILPYRLEMKQKFRELAGFGSSAKLADFWHQKVTRKLNTDLANLPENSERLIVNLASDEYAAAIDFNQIKYPVLKVDFLTKSPNSKSRMVALHSKHARGLMLDFMIQNQVEDPSGLEDFALGGYSLTQKNTNHLVFTRNA